MHLSQVDRFSVGVGYQPIIKNKLTRILCVFALIKIMLNALIRKYFINYNHTNYVLKSSICNNHIIFKKEIKSAEMNVLILGIFFLITMEILGYFYPNNPLFTIMMF